jgi:hypothetical protein
MKRTRNLFSLYVRSRQDIGMDGVIVPDVIPFSQLTIYDMPKRRYKVKKFTEKEEERKAITF